MPSVPHLCVCICTFQRPALLTRLLTELLQQNTEGLFTFSVVISDNDAGESGRAVAEQFAKNLPVTYVVQPVKNFALNRNTAVANATGDYIVFIDDDEFPTKDWLRNLLETCTRYNVAGVLGPVLPHYEPKPPAWVEKGGFYDRPTHPTGFELGWRECRTGNVLFRRSIIDGLPEVFRAEFRTGGEDQDFFRRMIDRQHKFIWCNEAVAYEVVPPGRWKRSVLIKRALLRGQNSFQHPDGRFGKTCKSLIAVPLYALALPFLLLGGQHLFMRYAIKFFDHFGRVLTLLGINPVRERANGDTPA
jgi:glycosyltransferase involved in cell wall biosynthesis